MNSDSNIRARYVLIKVVEGRRKEKEDYSIGGKDIGGLVGGS